ncbi:hypothetical protein DSM112329_00817 [Paraconexibacter sp. AEG42_29]|uniref:Nucleotidyltransferase family protein n=1 Tax=Paraconexibacter sp. AEG42_29 TaxID=2997339 RepID=A0AAU7AQS6_9ACTN
MPSAWAPKPPEELPLPTPAQLDLLRAALLPAPAAARAWARWGERGLRLGTTDRASRRLLGQLHHNHRAAGVGPEDVARLRASGHRTFAHNTTVLRASLPAVQLLEQAGMPVVLLKGAAVLALTGGIGRRPITDVDVLVPEHEGRRAIDLLLQAGWRSHSEGPPRADSSCHGWNFVDGDGGSLDLHWWCYRTAGSDAGVIRDARSAQLLGTPVTVPSPADLLLTTVVNGFGPLQAAPVRWIADSVVLLGLEADAVDWDTLVARARERDVTLPAAEGLEYLATRFGAPVPPATLTALRATPVALRTRLYHRSVMSPPRRAPVLVPELEAHRRRRLHDPEHTPWDFPRHFAQQAGAGTVRHLIWRSLTGALRPGDRR